MNIIENLVKGEIANLDRAIKDGKHDRRFYKHEFYTAVWNNTKLKQRQQEFLANQKKGWPDVDAYSDYVYTVITRALKHQKVIKFGNRYQPMPEFVSIPMAGQRERLFCRLTRLTADELRVSARAYLKLGAQNTAKGKILMVLADELESKGIKEATDELVKQVVEALANKGEI
jgi:hypothetical protein